MAASSDDLLHGTLDLLILKALALGPLHGWAISQRIHQLSRDALTVNQGSLYPGLYRLDERGWIRGEAAHTPEGRPVKVYHLLAAGRRQLTREISTWRRFSTAMDAVIASEVPS